MHDEITLMNIITYVLRGRLFVKLSCLYAADTCFVLLQVPGFLLDFKVCVIVYNI